MCVFGVCSSARSLSLARLVRGMCAGSTLCPSASDGRDGFSERSLTRVATVSPFACVLPPSVVVYCEEFTLVLRRLALA